ncbi:MULTISPECIES: hypothetical protein [unclassified Streptomyces]|uniref:hypothetical protein n=1 Tax=unclassified Streptomyces TaxID=2593676 RepID=UPI00369ACE78
MILHIDHAWLLELAHRSVPGDSDVLDFGTLQAAVARHADKVMDRHVYAQGLSARWPVLPRPRE